jgi:hypothetical protein
LKGRWRKPEAAPEGTVGEDRRKPAPKLCEKKFSSSKPSFTAPSNPDDLINSQPLRMTEGRRFFAALRMTRGHVILNPTGGRVKKLWSWWKRKRVIK